MILKRLYDDGLAQASYLIGCAATGEAIVIDPNRDIGQYLDAARSEGVSVTHVTETHIHADFLSGSRELAQVAGAQLFLSAHRRDGLAVRLRGGGGSDPAARRRCRHGG